MLYPGDATCEIQKVKFALFKACGIHKKRCEDYNSMDTK